MRGYPKSTGLSSQKLYFLIGVIISGVLEILLQIYVFSSALENYVGAIIISSLLVADVNASDALPLGRHLLRMSITGISAI